MQSAHCWQHCTRHGLPQQHPAQQHGRDGAEQPQRRHRHRRQPCNAAKPQLPALAGAVTQPGRDARSSLVQLTPQGLALIDRAVETHVASEHRILAALNAADLAALVHKLALPLAALESPEEQ